MPRYDTVLNPGSEALRAVDEGLHAYNLAHLGQEVIERYHRVAVVARDDAGQVIGGVHGELVWEWLHIDALWVEPAHRGQGVGTDLLARIEAAAVEHGFYGSHLETTSFQALEFYLRQGYEVFGRLADKPKGTTWYYLKKRLVPEPGARGTGTT